MRKRSKYKPKPVRLDTLNFVRTGITRFLNVGMAVDLRIKNHTALESVQLGQATKAHIDTLIGAFNMAEGLAQLDIGSDWAAEIRAGQDALWSLCQRNPRFICRGVELQALKLAMEIHDAQLEVCTIQQLEKALDIIQDTIKHKKARAVNKKAEEQCKT